MTTKKKHVTRPSRTKKKSRNRSQYDLVKEAIRNGGRLPIDVRGTEINSMASRGMIQPAPRGDGWVITDLARQMMREGRVSTRIPR